MKTIFPFPQTACGNSPLAAPSLSHASEHLSTVAASAGSKNSSFMPLSDPFVDLRRGPSARVLSPSMYAGNHGGMTVTWKLALRAAAWSCTCSAEALN